MISIPVCPCFLKGIFTLSPEDTKRPLRKLSFPNSKYGIYRWSGFWGEVTPLSIFYLHSFTYISLFFLILFIFINLFFLFSVVNFFLSFIILLFFKVGLWKRSCYHFRQWFPEIAGCRSLFAHSLSISHSSIPVLLTYPSQPTPKILLY